MSEVLASGGLDGTMDRGLTVGNEGIISLHGLKMVTRDDFDRAIFRCQT